ncbi:HlyC/CorC family transporter [Candidatus Pacearchaeota archaeon]|nr:HlyC/CorC family transporter [Candidatus Pacearchaeota archaeon]
MVSTTQIIILVILLFFSAFFSGIETAFMSISRVKVKSLVTKKKRGSKTLEKLKNNPHKLIITILIGNNLANIGAASLATVIFTNIFGSSGIGIATGVMTFLILIFGEISPKTFASQNATKISLLVSKPIYILSIILAPVVYVFEKITKAINKLFGSAGKTKLSHEEISTIVSMGKDEGILDKGSATMMHNLLQFEGTKATEIMTPDANIEMLDGNKKLSQMINFIVKSPFSKYPVYINDRDNIVGILDVDTVLKYVKNTQMNMKIKTIVKPAYFVPESKEIDDLLTELSSKKLAMAIVVDEYGHVSGLVTVEDILEEIVGEIFDKSQRTSVFIKKVNEKITRVDAKAPVQEVNKILHLGIKEKKFDTLAGFVVNKLKRIPKRGESIKLRNSVIIVDKVTPQGIKSVKIIKK